MQLSPALQQLEQLNMKLIMGKSGQDPDFEERLIDLNQSVWTNFLNEEVAYMLSDADQERLGKLFDDENTTQEQFLSFFREAIDDFDLKYKTYLLENKAESVKGRIQYLEVMVSEDAEKTELLNQANQAAEAGEWLRVEQILSQNFADFE